MILTVDIGNSNIVLAIFHNNKILKKWRLITSKTKSRDEYSMVIQQLMKTNDIDVKKISGIVLSSVVPEISFIFKEALKFIDARILTIGDENLKTGLKIKKTIESEIGSDIIATMVGGKKRFKENFIIIDMGTATAFDIGVKNGEYAGSIIVPGAQIGSEGLHERCSQLPLIEIKKPAEFMGNNTLDVLKSGIYYGYVGTIKEIVLRIKDSFKDIEFKVYVTGGLSSVFVQDLDFIDGVFPDLTCEGLNEIWNLNKKTNFEE